MSVDALVPLKRLDYAKTRLASVLDPPTRVRVMRALLDHTLEQVKAAKPTLDYDGIYGATSGPWTSDMFVEAVYRELAKKKVQEHQNAGGGKQ